MLKPIAIARSIARCARPFSAYVTGSGASTIGSDERGTWVASPFATAFCASCRRSSPPVTRPVTTSDLESTRSTPTQYPKFPAWPNWVLLSTPIKTYAYVGNESEIDGPMSASRLGGVDCRFRMSRARASIMISLVLAIPRASLCAFFLRPGSVNPFISCTTRFRYGKPSLYANLAIHMPILLRSSVDYAR